MSDQARQEAEKRWSPVVDALQTTFDVVRVYADEIAISGNHEVDWWSKALLEVLDEEGGLGQTV